MVSMQCEQQGKVFGRRSAVAIVAGTLLGSLVTGPVSSSVADDTGAAGSSADVAGVCTNILGCKIEGELKPPPQRFKSIIGVSLFR